MFVKFSYSDPEYFKPYVKQIKEELNDLIIKQEACRPIYPADCWNYDRFCNHDHNLVINQ